MAALSAREGSLKPVPSTPPTTGIGDGALKPSGTELRHFAAASSRTAYRTLDGVRIRCLLALRTSWPGERKRLGVG